jgi:hypothetical protein
VPSAWIAEKLHGLRGLTHDDPAAFFLAVEHTERVALETALALRAESVEMASDVTLELLAIAWPAGGIPQGVQVQR